MRQLGVKTISDILFLRNYLIYKILNLKYLLLSSRRRKKTALKCVLDAEE
jgi:hypothetical protein